MKGKARETWCPDPARYDRGECAWPRCKCPDIPPSDEASVQQIVDRIIAWQADRLAKALSDCLDTITAIANSGCSNKAHKILADALDIEYARVVLANYRAALALGQTEGE